MSCGMSVGIKNIAAARAFGVRESPLPETWDMKNIHGRGVRGGCYFCLFSCSLKATTCSPLGPPKRPVPDAGVRRFLYAEVLLLREYGSMPGRSRSNCK